MKKNQEELKALHEEISKNYICASWFYHKNQFFYLGSLLFAMLSAMTFNAVIDLPTMMLLLLLAMFYPIRKDYTVVYRTASFVTIYFVQLITYLKIMHDVLIGIDFVQSYL